MTCDHPLKYNGQRKHVTAPGKKLCRGTGRVQGRHILSTKTMALTILDFLARELDEAPQEFHVEVLVNGRP